MSSIAQPNAHVLLGRASTTTLVGSADGTEVDVGIKGAFCDFEDKDKDKDTGESVSRRPSSDSLSTLVVLSAFESESAAATAAAVMASVGDCVLKGAPALRSVRRVTGLRDLLPSPSNNNINSNSDFNPFPHNSPSNATDAATERAWLRSWRRRRNSNSTSSSETTDPSTASDNTSESDNASIATSDDLAANALDEIDLLSWADKDTSDHSSPFVVAISQPSLLTSRSRSASVALKQNHASFTSISRTKSLAPKALPINSDNLVKPINPPLDLQNPSASLKNALSLLSTGRSKSYVLAPMGEKRLSTLAPFMTRIKSRGSAVKESDSFSVNSYSEDLMASSKLSSTLAPFMTRLKSRNTVKSIDTCSVHSSEGISSMPPTPQTPTLAAFGRSRTTSGKPASINQSPLMERVKTFSAKLAITAISTPQINDSESPKRKGFPKLQLMTSKTPSPAHTPSFTSDEEARQSLETSLASSNSLSLPRSINTLSLSRSTKSSANDETLEASTVLAQFQAKQYPFSLQQLIKFIVVASTRRRHPLLPVKESLLDPTSPNFQTSLYEILQHDALPAAIKLLEQQLKSEREFSFSSLPQSPPPCLSPPLSPSFSDGTSPTRLGSHHSQQHHQRPHNQTHRPMNLRRAKRLQSTTTSFHISPSRQYHLHKSSSNSRSPSPPSPVTTTRSTLSDASAVASIVLHPYKRPSPPISPERGGSGGLGSVRAGKLLHQFREVFERMQVERRAVVGVGMERGRSGFGKRVKADGVVDMVGEL
ncbi:hypothetical protein HDU79_007607 [Rhizoclosmatium sp. JEL0117]|nr:hypothetical protein HDU79_007607 [Rhizoclosmatium sp. JEL0117]